MALGWDTTKPHVGHYHNGNKNVADCDQSSGYIQRWYGQVGCNDGTSCVNENKYYVRDPNDNNDHSQDDHLVSANQDHYEYHEDEGFDC